MNEMTIAKPLSGPEIIEAIVYKIRENLGKNTLLSPHRAYKSFSFDNVLTINLNSQCLPVEQAMGFAKGGSDGEHNGEETTIINQSQPALSPNEVRRDTEQGVPVLVKTPQGKVEEKRLKYAKKV